MASRRKAQKWFLTFPQLNELRPATVQESLQKFLDYMNEKLPDNKVIKAIVCHEDHADRGDDDGGSGVHIHIAFWLERKWNCPSDMLFFDALYGKHPNIQTCRKWEKSVVYVGKDGDYATLSIDYDAMVETSKSKKGYGFHEAANAIYKENKSLREVHDQNPGFYAREKRKLEEYAKQVNEWKQQDQVKPDFPGFQDVPMGQEDRREWQKIVDWVNINFSGPRQRRQDQLWIYGPKGIGKSYPFDTMLTPYKEVYPWNYDNRQDEQLQTCDFVLMDEMNGGVTLSFFKLFAQMSGTAKVTYRYGKLETFKRNIPLVVISNVHPDDIYVNAKVEDREAIKDRFLFANPQFPCHLQLNQEEVPTSPVITTQDYMNIPSEDLVEPESDEDHSEQSNEERRKRRKK